MFEISQLKEKKLVELQEIAEKLKVPKFKSLKKIDLVYQILDLQAANPTIVAPKATPVAAAKPPRPRRERISKPKEANPKPLAQNADSPASTEAKPASKVDSKKETGSENSSATTSAEIKTETKSETNAESKPAAKNKQKPQKQKNHNPIKTQIRSKSESKSESKSKL